MYLIDKKYSKQTLTIGPDYKNHRGGIGAVLEVYSKYFEDFKFLPTYKVGSSIFKTFFFGGTILKFVNILLFDNEIKIIHIHGASRGSFTRKLICFIIAKYVFRKKIIYHVHGAEYHLFYSKSNIIVKKTIQIFINNSDCIICLSEVWKNFFESNFKPKKIQIVANVIDYPSESNFKKVDSFCTFLFLGQIGIRKGIYDLLEVISKKRDKFDGKIKLFIGGNGEIEKLKNSIIKLQLEGIVEFIGWVSAEDKIKYLQNTNIYILPSYNEGLPISILEAMSYGKAIISTNVGGIPEIVIPGKNGILIEPGNLQELENSIDFFIQNPEKIKFYGNESKQIVSKHLPNKVIKELLNIYKLLLNE